MPKTQVVWGSMEKRKRAEHIHQVLARMKHRINCGNRVGDACRQLGLSRATYYRWQRRYGQMSAPQIEKQLRMKQEMRRLQREVDRANRQLGIATAALGQLALDPKERRKLAASTQKVCCASERMVCQTLDQARSTQRYQAKLKVSSHALSSQVLSMAAHYPRYGYRRIAQKLQERGLNVSCWQVYTIWRREKLAVPPSQRAKRQQPINWQTHRRRAKQPNHIWTWDFVRTYDLGGGRLLFLSLLDEFTRECLCLAVRREATAEWLIGVLEDVLKHRDKPRYLRSDNEDVWSEPAVRKFLSAAAILPLAIPPGAPWQNAYIESFQSRLWDEFLDTRQFFSLQEAQASAQRWKVRYNRHRAHSSLGNQTPELFAAQWQKETGLASPGHIGGRIGSWKVSTP